MHPLGDIILMTQQAAPGLASALGISRIGALSPGREVTDSVRAIPVLIGSGQIVYWRAQLSVTDLIPCELADIDIAACESYTKQPT